jgi:predicted amidohydrolase
MNSVIVASAQVRMGVWENSDEFKAEASRYLHQARAKAARLTIFPELSGVMLAPPLISGFKLGFVKREDHGKRPGSGFLSQSLGRMAGTTAGALGGGFRGSLERLLRKNSDSLRDLYINTFGDLAREFGTAMVGGSLYLYDEESGTVRNRAYVFDVDGEVLGYQDKFNLTPDERDLASPGTGLTIFETRFGRLGLLIGRDALYPELARLLAMRGADLLAGIAASPGQAQASAVRAALAVRAEENQVFGAASFLLGPNYLGRQMRDDYYGQSALFAPISMTPKGDGLLVQAGTNRTEGLIAAELDAGALLALRETSGFRPRQEMHLGDLGPVLAEMYGQGLTIEQAIEQPPGWRAVSIEEPPEFEIDPVAEPLSEPEEPEPEWPSVSPEDEVPLSVPEALSLTGQREAEE